MQLNVFGKQPFTPSVACSRVSQLWYALHIINLSRAIFVLPRCDGCKMASFKTILFESIDYNNTQWSFHVPGLPSSAKTNPAGLVKLLSVVSNDKRQIVELGFVKCPSNRVVSADPLDKFILISFSDFRLRVPCKADDRRTEPATGRESAEYVTQLLSNGICINNVTYNFYGHSNSQLKSRSCFLFAAAKDQVATKIEQLGDFSKIKTVAKKAKRIGLLFSTADVGVLLPTDRCEDIPDIQNKDYNFTDGCGLISVSLAKQLVKKINITFRNHKYTPSVFQIRYRGYKGVLMLEPALCGRILVQFRDSMRKFKDAADLTLSVVEFSKVCTSSIPVLLALMDIALFIRVSERRDDSFALCSGSHIRDTRPEAA